jgi:hypothetical protein
MSDIAGDASDYLTELGGAQERTLVARHVMGELTHADADGSAERHERRARQDQPFRQRQCPLVPCG